jgi:subtilisin family serine protease
VFALLVTVQPIGVADEVETTQVLASTSTGEVLSVFEPAMRKPEWMDLDGNCIADTLDQEIAQRTINATVSDYTEVIVMLKESPTLIDAEIFTEHNGYVTAKPWTQALYGFAGYIPYSRIASYIEADPNVLMIEKQQKSQAHIAYAARQIGARTYVWNNLSLQGDPQSSIAVLDTGIDDSHPDFAPGYGDLNFSKKIVGWNDQIASETEPYDDNGHGSHVAGLAGGNGFFSEDESGNAIATWGANLGVAGSTGTYLISGMMVNRTGPVTVNVKWTNTATGGFYSSLSALQIYNGSKSLSAGAWTKLAETSTPTRDTWYTLTYNVSSTPSGGYDMYHITMTLTGGLRGNLYVVFTVSWPYVAPVDGFSAWTGIAPQIKLVGVKALDYRGSGTSTGLIDAVDWIIANRQAYHIVIVSMSLGFESEVPAVDTAILNLVNSGITTVVSAGNSGYGGNYIFTPGSVDEAITVAATNQFDNVADYSSQGGISRYAGRTVKPDIAAPGGSFFAVPLSSADSNDWDADAMWSDVVSNDSALMQGTSMSAPVVSGAASLVMQALGGFSNWQWTRAQALQPKMILLMTATETYPLEREYEALYSPTLQRGGKDVHEGYGRLNVDLAVDAVLSTYQVGTTVSAALGVPPVISDVSVVGQRLGWARNVQLVPGARYNFTLSVPVGADLDLYLYNSTGTAYGEPSIVQKSISAGTGGLEQIVLDDVPYDGLYYLVVKRAFATTSAGVFTLVSSVTPGHEVSAVSVVAEPVVVYPVDPVNVTVTVKNNGLSVETFDVTVYYNATVVGTQTVVGLLPGSVAVLNFTWNTVGVVPGYYVVSAVADSVPGEYDLGDNVVAFPGAVVVKIPGDVNSDNVVDGADLVLLRVAYGSTILSVNWSSECDFNSDGLIDVNDVRVLGKNFGKEI